MEATLAVSRMHNLACVHRVADAVGEGDEVGYRLTLIVIVCAPTASGEDEDMLHGQVLQITCGCGF